MNKPRKITIADNEIEKAAIKAVNNFGLPEVLWIEDPLTEEIVFIDLKDPSAQAVETLKRVFGF